MIVKHLKIYTPHLTAQKEFYSSVLGLSAISDSKSSTRFQIGRSTLEFERANQSTPYHFAINIPSNKEEEALEWLKTRVDILKDGQSEIVDFKSWNARAIYFYDKDKNIVELIARKNLSNLSHQTFDHDSFLEISEVGLATADIKQVYQILHDEFGLEIYDGGFQKFCAIGSENGLFICVNKNTKSWFPADDKVHPSEFEIEFEEKGRSFEVEYKDEKLRAVVRQK